MFATFLTGDILLCALTEKRAYLLKVMQTSFASDIPTDEKEYRHMKEDYDRQTAELEKGIDTENPSWATFRQYQNIEKLTRDILIELVECIKIYENGNVSVKFRFADELRRITEFMEVNPHENAV